MELKLQGVDLYNTLSGLVDSFDELQTAVCNLQPLMALSSHWSPSVQRLAVFVCYIVLHLEV